jgi:lipopolysaccharide export system protein LptA
MRKNFFIHSVTLLFLLLWAGMPLQYAFAEKQKPEEPINIEADRMVSKQNENAVIFSGNVDARQGLLNIHADEITVYHQSESVAEQNSRNGNQKIEKLYADGNVKIVQGELVATGTHMEFFAEERKVLLKGDAKVWQDNNLVTGETVMLDLNTGTTVVEPNKKSGGRVKAFFYPENQ